MFTVCMDTQVIGHSAAKSSLCHELMLPLLELSFTCFCRGTSLCGVLVIPREPRLLRKSLPSDI